MNLYDLKEGKNITSFDSRYVYDNYGSTFLKASLYSSSSYEEAGYIIYNLLSNKSMNFGKDDEVIIGSNYLVVKKDGKRTYYNTDFKQIHVSTD